MFRLMDFGGMEATVEDVMGLIDEGSGMACAACNSTNLACEVHRQLETNESGLHHVALMFGCTHHAPVSFAPVGMVRLLVDDEGLNALYARFEAAQAS